MNGDHDAAVYDEVANVAATFWEWRNKVMRFGFGGIGLIFAISTWMYENEMRHFIAVPLAFGAALSAVSALFDRRSSWILDECYRVGARIETRWHNTLRPDAAETHEAASESSCRRATQ